MTRRFALALLSAAAPVLAMTSSPAHAQTLELPQVSPAVDTAYAKLEASPLYRKLMADVRADDARALAELKTMTEAAGRDFSQIQIAPQYVVHLGKDQAKAVARYRESQMFKHLESLKKSTLKQQSSTKSEDINLVGSFQTVIERAQSFRDAGVTHFLGLFFAANSPDELMDQMQMFAEEIRPHIR